MPSRALETAFTQLLLVPPESSTSSRLGSSRLVPECVFSVGQGHVPIIVLSLSCSQWASLNTIQAKGKNLVS